MLKILNISCVLFLATILISCSEDTSATNNPEPQTKEGMVLIESGGSSFMMGSENGSATEQLVHNVTFSNNFWMSTTEITQSDYGAIMAAGYSEYKEPFWGESYGLGDNYPAYAVEWGDCVLYCNARSISEGLDTVYTYTDIEGKPGNGCFLDEVETHFDKNGYRLPTEAEWEFACRAGSTTDYYWGKDYDQYPSTSEDSSEIGTYAVWVANAWEFGAGAEGFGNHEVGTKTANAFGLFDMTGNASEWVNDWSAEYTAGTQIDPIGSETETWHTARGGNWGNVANALRSSNREFESPDYYMNFVGFRVVLPTE